MRKRGKYVRALQIIALILLSLALQACGDQAANLKETHADEHSQELPTDTVELTPEAIRKANIRVMESKRIELQEYLETTGVVSPDESRIAHIRPLARGVVEKVYVLRGDRVRQGQALLQYDNIELGELIGEYLSQKAQLQKYLSEMEMAKKFWERGVELLDVQAIAQKEVELREAQFKNTQAMVESRRAEMARTEEKLHRFGLSDQQIKQLDASNSAGHRTASHGVLRAPFSGVIIGYDVAEGELVDSSRELMTLADVSTVWVLADIYEKDLGFVREGQPVEVQSSSYAGQIFEGRLTYMSDVLDSKTRTAKARTIVPNPAGLLKLEMFVSIKIPSARLVSAVAVPESAIQNIDNQEVMFIAEGRARFRKKTVQTGRSADGWIEVTGLAEGIPVVADGSFYLKSALKRSEIEVGHGH
ncbi:MAG: efflux RND transporter periplasmic adaptor subunit [Acidobacteriota bacterium]